MHVDVGTFVVWEYLEPAAQKLLNVEASCADEPVSPCGRTAGSDPGLVRIVTLRCDQWSVVLGPWYNAV